MIEDKILYNETYLKEQKQLMDYYINTDLFPLPKDSSDLFINRNGIELIVRPDCNQKCEYCYITKYGKDLYPEHANKEEILHNMKLLLDWIFYTRKNYSYNIELFAGDLFFDGIFFDIIELLEKYLEDIHSKHSTLKEHMTAICIPSNLSFVVEKPEYVNKILEIMARLRNKYNARICFSWSSDGLYAIDSREKKKLDEEYFEKITDFCEKSSTGAHPMIAPENIKNWIDNYKWWLENYGKRENTIDFQPMMLEVRNENWTDENIEDYKSLLNIMMQVRLAMCGNDLDKLAYHFWVGDGKDDTVPRLENYDPIDIILDKEDYRRCHVSCSMQKLVHLNCTNLSINICHRLTYSLFTPLHFITNEDNTKIIDYDIHNIDGFIQIRTMSKKMLPICSSCDFEAHCLKGCLGAQYEYSGELLMPIPAVCKMFKEKAKKLAELYYDYKIFECGLKNNYITRKEVKWYLDYLESIGKVVK